MKVIKSIIKTLLNQYGYEIRRKNIKLELEGLGRDTALSFEEAKSISMLEKIQIDNSLRRVHLGCGPRILKGWINIDLVYEPFDDYLQYYTNTHYPPEIRGKQYDFYPLDIAKFGIPLPDDSVDIVFHEDFIEHLTQRSQIIVLAESLRILKKGGVHRISTPDLLISMQESSDFSQGLKGIFLEEWDNNKHINIFTQNLLKEMALMIGYQEVIFNFRNKSICANLLPSEYRPDQNDRSEIGNIFADLIK